ncbi:hypothetical protein TrVFT333_010941 [Trichoderma virens FT-333]|nr:hypothetical protein TrVFT333_010941 [Trichoderma virens FT-333]
MTFPERATQDVRAFRYYHDQMLYAFDTVVVVHDTTLTEADIRLLQMCIHSGKNCLAVRTKSDNHIRNYAYDKDCELEEAREIFLRETRHDIQSCHKEITAPWPEKEIRIWDYIINSRSVRTFMKGKPSPKEADTAYIDEFDFIFDLSPGLVINPND